MKCEDLLRALNDYVDGDVDPAICEAFAGHLADCNPCQIVVDNIRKTITLYRGQQSIEVPLPFQERLHQQIRQKWQQHHTPPS